MVHTSLEKSWNLNHYLKSHWIIVGLEKWHFARKSNWKSVKAIEKYQVEKVGYFKHMIIMRFWQWSLNV